MCVCVCVCVGGGHACARKGLLRLCTIVVYRYAKAVKRGHPDACDRLGKLEAERRSLTERHRLLTVRVRSAKGRRRVNWLVPLTKMSDCVHDQNVGTVPMTEILSFVA